MLRTFTRLIFDRSIYSRPDIHIRTAIQRLSSLNYELAKQVQDISAFKSAHKEIKRVVSTSALRPR